ncbi:hypothetical protein N431DRAFT_463851 [Stipitochalara longipes BDJ]|nr:hypothetical protein N431DRAFT_463851 [Stipitochalara longipes BDJ]
MPKHKPHLRVSHSALSYPNPSPEPFRLNRHDASSLSNLLISNSKHRSASLSPPQQNAMSKLQTSHLLDIKKNHRYTLVEILRAYFSFFDDLFFFRSLKLRCGLRFCFQKGNQTTFSGVTTLLGKEQQVLQRMKGKGYEKRRVLITIFLREREERSREEMLVEYQGTLLHEMIHALLMCWASDYEGCSDAKNVIGEGHGPVWQDIAHALEKATRDQSFLNLELRLRREEALASEAHRAGRWPGGDELARWNISERDFLESYQAVDYIEGAVAVKEALKIGSKGLIWEGMGGYESEVEAFPDGSNSGFEPLHYRSIS